MLQSFRQQWKSCSLAFAALELLTTGSECVTVRTELNTGVMLLRNNDWTRGFINDIARLGKMHVNHWQLMDQVSFFLVMPCGHAMDMLSIALATAVAHYQGRRLLWCCFTMKQCSQLLRCAGMPGCCSGVGQVQNRPHSIISAHFAKTQLDWLCNAY